MPQLSYDILLTVRDCEPAAQPAHCSTSFASSSTRPSCFSMSALRSASVAAPGAARTAANAIVIFLGIVLLQAARGSLITQL